MAVRRAHRGLIKRSKKSSVWLETSAHVKFNGCSSEFMEKEQLLEISSSLGRGHMKHESLKHQNSSQGSFHNSGLDPLTDCLVLKRNGIHYKCPPFLTDLKHWIAPFSKLVATSGQLLLRGLVTCQALPGSADGTHLRLDLWTLLFGVHLIRPKRSHCN